jgi:alcohol dehydrogenase class IV
MEVPVPQDGAAGIVRQFVESLGMPTTLRKVGVTREDFPFLARDAVRDLILATNPRPLKGESDVIEVLELAY